LEKIGMNKNAIEFASGEKIELPQLGAMRRVLSLLGESRAEKELRNVVAGSDRRLIGHLIGEDSMEKSQRLYAMSLAEKIGFDLAVPEDSNAVAPSGILDVRFVIAFSDDEHERPVGAHVCLRSPKLAVNG
jgi:hypothetical protein